MLRRSIVVSSNMDSRITSQKGFGRESRRVGRACQPLCHGAHAGCSDTVGFMARRCKGYSDAGCSCSVVKWGVPSAVGNAHALIQPKRMIWGCSPARPRSPWRPHLDPERLAGKALQAVYRRRRGRLVLVTHVDVGQEIKGGAKQARPNR
jgi:hypothetical protein